MAQTVFHDDAYLAQRVKQALQQRGLNQRALAQELDVTDNWVSRRLRAQTPFTAVELWKVAEVLDVPASELLGSAA